MRNWRMGIKSLTFQIICWYNNILLKFFIPRMTIWYFLRICVGSQKGKTIENLSRRGIVINFFFQVIISHDNSFCFNCMKLRDQCDRNNITIKKLTFEFIFVFKISNVNKLMLFCFRMFRMWCYSMQWRLWNKFVLEMFQ